MAVPPPRLRCAGLRLGRWPRAWRDEKTSEDIGNVHFNVDMRNRGIFVSSLVVCFNIEMIIGDIFANSLVFARCCCRNCYSYVLQQGS